MDAESPLPPLPPLRLLLVSPGRIASTQIFDLVFRGLAEQGAIAYRAVYELETDRDERQEAVLDADIVFFLRSFDEAALDLLRFARRHGRRVVYSTDDDFRALDPDSPLGRVHLAPHRLASYEAMFSEADLVWLYTGEMRRRHEGLARRIVLGRLPSFVEWNAPADPTCPEPAGDGIVVGYGGSSSHAGDLRAVGRPLRDALDRWPGLRVQFVNAAPAGLADHPRVEVRPFMGDLLDYYRFMRDARWTIGIAPLLDDAFNRGKTSNKYREYAGLGIPGIYSRMPVYEADVRHGETGLLAPHDEDGFAGALRALVEQPELRRRIRVAALQDATSRFSLDAMRLQFLGELSRLAISTGLRSWRRPRVLVAGYASTSSMQIGALQPLRRLEREGLVEVHHAEPATLAGDAAGDAIAGMDAVVVVRAFEPVTMPLLAALRARRLPLVAAWDDDFPSIPPGTPVGDWYRHPDVVRAIDRYVADASLVLASTPPLAARTRELGGRAMEAIYGLDEESLPAPPAGQPAGPPAPADGRPPLRIGFFGSNDALALPWMVEALRLVRQRHGASVAIEAIGVTPGPELAALLDWFAPGVLPYREALALLRERRWDIGLAPLEDTVFNAAKQATKFRDYAWAGVAMICSRVPAYERVLREHLHGLFAGGTAGEWSARIDELVESPEIRARLVAGASALLAGAHLQSLTDASWLQVLWRIGVFGGPGDHGGDFAAGPIVELVGEEPAISVPLDRERRWSFTAAHDRLCGIEVCLGAAPHAAGTRVAFALRLPGGEILRRGGAAVPPGRAGTWLRLRFAELRNSAGRRLVFSLAPTSPVPAGLGVFESSRPAPARLARLARRAGLGALVAGPFLRLVHAPARSALEVERAEGAGGEA